VIRTGVLLVNLGTPGSARTADVRRYLREFLGDPRVLDMHPIARKLLLEGVILPLRPRRSAAAYRCIWTEEGSPLLVWGRALRDGVAGALGSGFEVALGMRYGAPSIRSALDALREAGVDKIVVLPLFPQYSSAATGSALAKVFEELARWNDIPATHTIASFFDHPAFISAFAETTREQLADFGADHLLFSYHGLPEAHVRASDATGQHCLAGEGCCDALVDANRSCYRAHCFATTRALASALELEAEGHSVAFQSRLGRTPWIQPYTDLRLPELAAEGVKRLAVICPAFVADCLETLEEIGIRAAEQWRELGGEELRLVTSLNAEPAWVEAVAGMVREQLSTSRKRPGPSAPDYGGCPRSGRRPARRSATASAPPR
jgi:ferrochelatase